MIAFQSRRLAGVFGRPLDRLTAADVEAAVAGQVREEEDLDFKEKPYAVDKADQVRREISKDVAAFANGQGGVILIGIEETNGVAARAAPVDCSDQMLRNLRAAVAGLIAPMPIFGVDPIPLPGNPSEGYILITIPRSADAPHAVRWDTKEPQPLVYPRRVGTQTIFLSENQIAAAYRNRFSTAREQVDELKQVEEAGTQRLASMKGWLRVSLVPHSPADIRIGYSALAVYPTWARAIHSLVPGSGPFEDREPFVTTRARRIVLGAQEPNLYGDSQDHANYIELYSNGAGFAASPLFEAEVSTQGFLPTLTAKSPLNADAVVLALSGLLTLLVDHAVSHGGLVGDAVVRLSVFNAERFASPTEPNVRAPVSLGRQGADRRMVNWSKTRVVRTFPITELTLSLYETLKSGREHLLALRLLLTDFFQSFGLIEVPHIDEQGGLRKRYWSQSHWEHLEVWARNASVELHDRDLGT